MVLLTAAIAYHPPCPHPVLVFDAFLLNRLLRQGVTATKQDLYSISVRAKGISSMLTYRAHYSLR